MEDLDHAVKGHVAPPPVTADAFDTLPWGALGAQLCWAQAKHKQATKQLHRPFSSRLSHVTKHLKTLAPLKYTNFVHSTHTARNMPPKGAFRV